MCNVTLLSRLEESIPILLLFFFSNLDEFSCHRFGNFARRFAKIVTKYRRVVLLKLFDTISRRKWIFEKVEDQPDYLAR